MQQHHQHRPALDRPDQPPRLAAVADAPDPGDPLLGRQDSEFFRVVLGSRARGLDRPTSDINMLGVRVAYMDEIIRLSEPPFSEYRHVGSQSGVSINLTVYGVMHAMVLISRGDITLTEALYVPQEDRLMDDPAAEEFVEITTQHLVSRVTLERFAGAARSNAKRMLILRTSEGHRFGYEPRVAALSMRFALQGLEMATTGRLSLPMRTMDIDTINSVRAGLLSPPEMSDALADAASRLERVIAPSPLATSLQPEPDLQIAEEWLRDIYREVWEL